MKLRKWTMLLVIFTLLTACSAEKTAPLAMPEVPIEEEVLTDWQKTAISDFDFLWTTFQDNYPLWGAVEREGKNIDELYSQYSELAKATTDLGGLERVVKSLFGDMSINRLTHLGVGKDVYALYAEQHEGVRETDPWYDIIMDKDIERNYGPMPPMSAHAFAEYQNTTDPEILKNAVVEKSPNIDVRLDKERGFAWIKIKSFSPITQAYDTAALLKFYEEIKDAPVVIFDVSQNKGGSDYFWMEAIVAPNITEKTKVEYTALFPKGDYADKFFKGEMDKEFPISELKMPEDAQARENIESDIKSGYIARAVISDFEVDPTTVGAKMLNGKIYIICGNDTFSAADTFVSFAQGGGFATIVGSATGGAGPGGAPILLKLPETGMLIRYDPCTVLNDDGFYNSVYGTSPDIEMPAPNFKNLNSYIEAIVRDAQGK